MHYVLHSTDKYSEILENKARTNGVNVQYQYVRTVPTGTCAVLLTGDNRSLCANLAAANHFTIDHIRKQENRKCIEDALYYYVSGFFLTVSPESILEVAKYACLNNRPFLMNLSAPFISQFYKEPLMQVMPYVDVLFGNETEAATFATEQAFGTSDLREIARRICKLPKQNGKRSRMCIITTGDKPVIVAQEDEVKEFPVVELTKQQLIDTNGAVATVTSRIAAFEKTNTHEKFVRFNIIPKTNSLIWILISFHIFPEMQDGRDLYIWFQQDGVACHTAWNTFHFLGDWLYTITSNCKSTQLLLLVETQPSQTQDTGSQHPAGQTVTGQFYVGVLERLRARIFRKFLPEKDTPTLSRPPVAPISPTETFSYSPR
ncbi:hypothetical protein Trydic_g14003 [Trypoxylus dichotomus]